MGLTFLDVAKRNAADSEIPLIDETMRAVPEVSGINLLTGEPVNNIAQARSIRGINYRTIVRTALPAVGFRDGNEGVATTKSTRENRLIECYIMNPRWDVDCAIADSDEEGPEALIADEAAAHLEASYQQLGKQFYYGIRTSFGGKAKGFPGLIDAVSSSMTVDAGGTTDNVASSVWAVCWGPTAVRWVLGADGKFQFSDIRKDDATDADGNQYLAYKQELMARPGIQIASGQCVGRIKKLTTDSGKGLTTALLRSLVQKFTDVGKRPDAIYMTQRSYDQYEAHLESLAIAVPEATRRAFRGIPFVVTNSISDTETLAL